MKFSAKTLKKIVKGACYFEEERGYLTAYKYCRAQLDMMCKEGYDTFWRDRAFFSAGIRLEIKTDSPFISFDYKANEGTNFHALSNSVDVWVNGALYSVLAPDTCRGKIKIDLPEGEKTVDVYFPCDCKFSVKNFTIEGKYKSIKDKGQKVLVIGDSITQGYGPEFSSASYFNELQRQTGYNMLNQGVGGYRCEPQDLMYVDGFEPDKIITFLGTNWYDAADVYDYEKATVEFYKRLTELYPNKEILAVSPIWRGDDGLNPERFNWCIEIVKRECQKYKNINPVDGFTLVPHVYECFCDKLHPNAYGCLLLATNLCKEMKRVGF